jgi:hypothetical protein
LKKSLKYFIHFISTVRDNLFCIQVSTKYQHHQHRKRNDEGDNKESHHGINERQNQITVSTKMTEMESKERINPNERLNLCLTNLFQGPSQGIEKAFNFILELLEKQQKEHDELKSAHAEFDTRNKELVANLKREFEESNEIIQKKFEVENEQLKECVEAIRKERDDLLKDNVDIRAKQSSFENLLYDMKKEVKVRFNLIHSYSSLFKNFSF